MQRAKYCLTCGTTLRARCRSCSLEIADFKHRFCPSCGTAYSE
ncbi:MAG: zinc ribbon domain-containing protein [Rhizonema sp. PD38]|nr:zinc ribbon domain-containing protein [Rhizonema sp. PD38]